jgi:PhoPQ-activated pathogenicity-related protein
VLKHLRHLAMLILLKIYLSFIKYCEWKTKSAVYLPQTEHEKRWVFFFAANGSKRKTQNAVDCREQKQTERELGSKRKTDVWDFLMIVVSFLSAMNSKRN